MENKKLIGIISASLGAIIFILSLVFFILSFGSDNYGEYGAEFWADADYIIFMIVGIAYAGYGIYVIKNENQSNTKFINSSIFVLVFTGFVDLAYCFGKFFKSIAKGKGFDTWYFCFGFAGILLFTLGLLIYFKNKDKKTTE